MSQTQEPQVLNKNDCVVSIVHIAPDEASALVMAWNGHPRAALRRDSVSGGWFRYQGGENIEIIRATTDAGALRLWAALRGLNCLGVFEARHPQYG
jgi:hypothetical protein